MSQETRFGPTRKTRRTALAAAALAALAVASLPHTAEARRKLPGMAQNCSSPRGTVPHGEELLVIDDENCASAEYWCNNGTLCYVVKRDAVCSTRAPGSSSQTLESGCVQSPASLTSSGTLTPAKLPNMTLGTWY